MLLGKHVLGVEIRRRHLLAALLAAVGLGLGLAWALLPGAGLRWGLVKALRDLGMAEVTMSDADLSLFQGRATIRRMEARPPLGAALGIRDFALLFRWRPLLDRKVMVDRIALRGVEVDVRRDPRTGGFVINGLPLPAAAAGSATDAAWGLSVTALELADSRLILADGGTVLDIQVANLVIENLNSQDSVTPASFRLEGRLNGAPLRLAGSLLPFAATPSFNLSVALTGLDLAQGGIAARTPLDGLAGRADLTLSAGGALRPDGLTVRVSGKAALTKPALTAPLALTAGRIALDVGHADWDGRRLDLAAAVEAETLSARTGDMAVSARSLRAVAAGLTWDGRLAWRGSLDAAGTSVAIAGIKAIPDRIAWNGVLDLDPAADPSGRAEGRLDLGGLRLTMPGLSYAHRHALAEGWLAFGPGTMLPVTAKVALSAEGLALGDPARRLEWLALERLDAAGAEVDAAGAVSADRLDIAGLAALRRQGRGGHFWRVEARAARLDHPRRGDAGDMAAAALHLDGLTLRVTRTRDGLTGLSSAGGEREDAAAPAIRLSRLNVAGASRILFEDRTLAEPVRLEARDVSLAASDIDSGHPERDSRFALKAGIGAASVALSGTVRPFAAPLSARLDGRIQALELPPLSPYLAEALGIHLQTGQFDGTFTGGADQGALDGRLDIALHHLFIAPPDPAAPVARKLDMPVETVLDLLRDGEDRIRLSLPVRGDLDNPDLDVSDAVAQAVAGALKSTVLTTLKIAFPVATLISMVVDADEKARLALAPLTFAAGSDALSDGSRETLDGVAGLMKDRPGLKLTLCGKADPGDWPVLAESRRFRARTAEVDRDALVRLAESRAAAAKAYLVERTGVEAGRLFTCRPEVEAGSPAAKGARVDLLL
ncbi:DUF748 domain-containing protein [Magnetospirillum sp. SS-4]|uniref:DUF748 domain-containing protein n=1 Tax=Magnetospirillum sp. SS-4 TaxID=2681465 RepID=UPI00138623A8|nr:DUF748 domain-containing protein [Magnetospirillum sp. SS-4]CAA7627495.1 conserved exported hypothetical protein [Magnetospirillum sp. SS-4]